MFRRQRYEKISYEPRPHIFFFLFFLVITIFFPYLCSIFVSDTDMPNKETNKRRWWEQLKSFMKTHVSLSIIVVAALLLMPAFCMCAQTDSTKANTLSLDLNYLSHGEIVRGGLPVDGDEETEDKSHFLLGRLRLIVDYNRPGLAAHAIIQNSAVWGTSGDKALNLYEGWVKMTAKNGLFAQVGRIALSYDDERIIGTNDFAMAAQSHDVIRVGYEGYGHKVHAILGYNQNASNVYSGTYYEGGSQAYKTLQTVWYHYDVPKFPLGASLLFMNVGLQSGEKGSVYNPPSTEYQQMYGGYVNFHPRYLTLEGSYYKQTGKFVNPAVMQAAKIDAWMASVKATIKPSDNYGFTLGYDYLSGDDYVPMTYGGELGLPRHDVQKGFNPLYGSRAKFYGIMDYFYERAYINGFTPGLQNAFVGIFGNPVAKLNCGATYHYLAVATDLNKLNSTLGHSIDMKARYRFTKDISLTAGYTMMFGTETMDRLKQGNGSKTARWGWFSLVVSPSLFTTKF